jgi:ribosomal protein L12E/L44/L45/RPP1/RPP2
MKEWLVKWELEEYLDQFMANGVNKKTHLLQFQKDAGGNLQALKDILNEFGIKMSPMHARTLLNALNDPSLFDMKEWLVKWELDEYFDQLVASGITKKTHLLGIKEEAADNLTVLKEILTENNIKMLPIHARPFMKALKDLY